jgi:transcriptional regulator with XRE-family HTH domain
MDHRAMQKPSVDVHIGQRLRLFREQHGLSQAAFAGSWGLSIAALDDRETGCSRISLESLLAPQAC